jgi:hypothetical protein
MNIGVFWELKLERRADAEKAAKQAMRALGGW